MEFPEEIKSIENAIQIIRKFREDVENNCDDFFYNYKTLNSQSFFTDIWFRGEARNYSMPLTPKIFRSEYDETTIFNYLPTYVNELREIDNDFDRLCYMQHYGVPTRLLDWTDNILIALYFVVNDEPDQDGKLFAINSRLLNRYTGLRDGNKNILTKEGIGTSYRCIMSHSDTQEEWCYGTKNVLKDDFDWLREDFNEIPLKEIFHTTKENLRSNLSDWINVFSTPVAVRPDKSNNRIIQQSGLFTLHGGKRNNSNKINRIPEPKTLTELNNIGKFLKEFPVPKNAKKDIKNDLLLLQIHTGKIFPELEKQDEFINIIGSKNIEI